MEKGTKLVQKIESDLNGMIYVFDGGILIENKMSVRTRSLPFGFGTRQAIQNGELAILSEGEEITIQCTSKSEFLILAGPELNEPVERYGPFVMNTREEIHQAFSDFQNGTFAS